MKSFLITPNSADQRSLGALCGVAFCWGFSSLMVFVALPLFMKELGASNSTVGWVEGVALGASFFTKVLTGVASDHWKCRKPFIWVGAAGTVAVKALFTCAQGLAMVQWARILDRFSKGVRTAPADALVADLAVPQHRGAAFSLKQSLWTLGSACGALVSGVLLARDAEGFRLIFILSAVPALLALALLQWGVKEGVRRPLQSQAPGEKKGFQLKALRTLPRLFWQFLAIVFVLMLARFSEVFLILHAKEVGWPVGALPLLIVLMDAIHAATAYGVAPMSDRWPTRPLFIRGTLVLTAATLVFGLWPSVPGVILGVSLNALHLGLTQGLMKKIIAEHTPAELQGTAFSCLYCVCGLGVMLGNPIAGYLSQNYGFSFTFLAAGFFAWLSAFLLLHFIKEGSLEGRQRKISEPLVEG